MTAEKPPAGNGERNEISEVRNKNQLFVSVRAGSDQGLSARMWDFSLLVLYLLSFGAAVPAKRASFCFSLKELQRQVNVSAFIMSTSPFFPLKHKRSYFTPISFQHKSTGSELMSKVFVWRSTSYWHLYSSFHRLRVKTLYRAINHTPFLMKLYVGNWAPILPSARSHVRDTGSVMKPAEVRLNKWMEVRLSPPQYPATC